MSELFIVRITPNMDKMKANPEDRQTFSKGHHDYIENLVSENVIQCGGPIEGKPGGMLIVKGDSLNAVKQIFGEDPMIKNQFLNAEVNKWTIKHGKFDI